MFMSEGELVGFEVMYRKMFFPLADKPRVRSFYHKSHDGHPSGCVLQGRLHYPLKTVNTKMINPY